MKTLLTLNHRLKGPGGSIDKKIWDKIFLGDGKIDKSLLAKEPQDLFISRAQIAFNTPLPGKGIYFPQKVSKPLTPKNLYLSSPIEAKDHSYKDFSGLAELPEAEGIKTVTPYDVDPLYRSYIINPKTGNCEVFWAGKYAEHMALYKYKKSNKPKYPVFFMNFAQMAAKLSGSTKILFNVLKEAKENPNNTPMEWVTSALDAKFPKVNKTKVMENLANGMSPYVARLKAMLPNKELKPAWVYHKSFGLIGKFSSSDEAFAFCGLLKSRPATKVSRLYTGFAIVGSPVSPFNEIDDNIVSDKKTMIHTVTADPSVSRYLALTMLWGVKEDEVEMFHNMSQEKRGYAWSLIARRCDTMLNFLNKTMFGVPAATWETSLTLNIAKNEKYSKVV